MIGHPALPPRFWAKVEEDERGCWIWTGALNSRGYGSFGLNGKRQSTHRVTWETFVGFIPDDLTIDHLCRVKACCNPAHLEAVTRRENVQRHFAHQTHCAQGHPLSGDNLSIHTKRKTRVCLTCKRDADRRWRESVKARAAA